MTLYGGRERGLSPGVLGVRCLRGYSKYRFVVDYLLDIDVDF